jgi:hypothetical protein
MITSNRALCAQFRQENLDYKTIKEHGGQGRIYTTDTRCAFTDYVDAMHRDGQISDRLAQSAHLTPRQTNRS